MIDRKALLDDCKDLMRQLEADLIARSHGTQALPEAVETLQEEYRKAKDAKRTAQNFEDWRTDYATQQAAAWVLSAVFVRFLEDNELIDPPQLAGPGERLKHARDQHELYFRAHPTETDREYLLNVFQEVGKLPGGREIFGKYNPVFEMPHWLSGDAAGEILTFFQRIDADTGDLVHDFTDPKWDTRFLGDLYQDLSEAARKKYALLQTPEFVEEFILDRTLEPALDEFGLDAPPVKNNQGEDITDPGFRMVDPACGSGHFLLGAFRRILDRWQRKEPRTNVRELVQRTLNSVNGVDVNPYAIAIARFRLLIAALQACAISQLKNSPAFHFSLTTGDSLLHGAPGAEQQLLSFDPLAHHYQTENINELRQILRPGTFHAVVANPPYITVKDKLLNQAYRERYEVCYRQYSLAVPFMERIFGLGIDGRHSDFRSSGGYTGQITANSFMKREFGKRLIEHFFAKNKLTTVVDSSGAFIPGHGTPTVLIFGNNDAPMSTKVRTVMGIRGEPSTPEDPAKGHVWQDICSAVENLDADGAYVSVAELDRDVFQQHPWSLGGGGASELLNEIQSRAYKTLNDESEEIGFSIVTREDEAYHVGFECARRQGVSINHILPMVSGEDLRDWQIESAQSGIWPYSPNSLDPELDEGIERFLWPIKATLSDRVAYGATQIERGLSWFEYSMFFKERFQNQRSIVYAAVAPHNHFVYDAGAKVFKQSAPVIKFGESISNEKLFALTAFLNSSLVCFYMKQVSHQKQMTGGDGIRIESRARVPYDFAATQIGRIPIPKKFYDKDVLDRLAAIGRSMYENASELSRLSMSSVVSSPGFDQEDSVAGAHQRAQEGAKHLRSSMVLFQEDIDFLVYDMFEITDSDILIETAERSVESVQEGQVVSPGQRPFEILSQRSEDDFPVPLSIPDNWPKHVQKIWSKRLEVLKGSKRLQIIEDAHYKRRWIGRQGLFKHTANADEFRSELGRFLLAKLEGLFDVDNRMNDTATTRFDPAVCSVARIANAVQADEQFQKVGEAYTGDAAFDVTELVSELVERESVPHLPTLRYKASGLRKRQEWEETWALQRQEDAIDVRTELPTDDPQYLTKEQATRLKKQEVGDIPVPPKYKSSDFQKGHYWRLRGKLDVPKERWVSFPYCEGQDGTLMIAWAGYDHLQLAKAISAHYVDIQERIGGRDDPRLIPLLASLIEQLPWLKQWHNEVDPEYNMAMGDYFEGFVQEEARGLGKTLDEIRAWQPPETKRRRGRRKKKATST